MGRKSKYIVSLSLEEKAGLKAGYSYGASPLYRRKCHCILLSNRGKSTQELADFFEVSTQSILIWFKLWEQDGLQGLQLKSGRGRKPKLDIADARQVATVKTLVENEPKNLRKVTAQIKEELGVEMSKRTLKRFLKNLTTSGNASRSV